MKILYVVQDSSIAHLFFKELIIKLNESNDLTLLYLDDINRFSFREATIQGVYTLYWKDLNFLQRLKIIRENDVCHLEMLRSLIPLKIYSLIYGSKFSLTIHGWISNRRDIKTVLIEKVLNRLAKVWVLNESDVSHLSGVQSVSTLNAHGFGVKSNRFFSYPPNRALNGLFIGRWNELKGFHLLPGFLKDCETIGIRFEKFFVIGNLDELRPSNKIDQALEELKKLPYVDLVGPVSNVEEYYKQANFFILPSQREGISVAMSEAIVNGKILITYQCRGVSELIDGKFSLPFDLWGDTMQLARLTKKYTENEAFYTTYLKHISDCKMLLKREYCIKDIVNEYLKTWNQNEYK